MISIPIIFIPVVYNVHFLVFLIKSFECCYYSIVSEFVKKLKESIALQKMEERLKLLDQQPQKREQNQATCVINGTFKHSTDFIGP